jgi:hypothetical protein
MKEERQKQDASAQNRAQCPTMMNNFTGKIIRVTREKENDDRTTGTYQVSIGKSDEEFYLSKMLEWLMPWSKKSGGLQELADWELTLPEIMMMKLVKLWLSDENRLRLDKVLHGYHPLDRAAMAYALLVYIFTGTKIHFKSVLPEQHFRVLCRAIETDMADLPFADHLLYNLTKFGKKHLDDYNGNNA